MIEVNCYVYDILRLVFWSEVKGGIEVVIVVAGHVGPDEDPADQKTEITQTAGPSPPHTTFNYRSLSTVPLTINWKVLLI